MRNEIGIARWRLHHVVAAANQLQVLCRLLDTQIAIATIVIHFVLLLVDEQLLRLI